MQGEPAATSPEPTPVSNGANSHWSEDRDVETVTAQEEFE
jgi:hypothetical protein